jgi:hypothetical protein
MFVLISFRCHRIGQKKPVEVLRLILPGTIETVMQQRVSGTVPCFCARPLSH